jgi:hypothetical protein
VSEGDAMAKPMVKKRCWGRKEVRNKIMKKVETYSIFKPRQLPLSTQVCYLLASGAPETMRVDDDKKDFILILIMKNRMTDT